ncbi:MAG TPA: transcriptional regulator [Candidatus Bathyarchaeia archaeon]|nr:transcriptional regulator [Candidatus Bathyarchaeia archaeon]
MVSKDQAIGGVICLVCVLVAVFYIVGLFGYDLLIKPWLNIGSFADVKFWLIAVPVLVGFVAILAIGAWIGWTMATTPPPKPIEEITTEMEEKKEEPKMEEMKPEETATGTMTEEKKPEKKKKS